MPGDAEWSGVAVAVVRPPGSDAEAYEKAARAVVGSRRFESNRVIDFSAKKTGIATDLAIEALQHPKAIFLFSDAASIPDLVRMAVDLVVELKPPNIRTMKGVFKWRDKMSLTD